MNLHVPVYLDTMGNDFHKVFSVWPERYHIVNSKYVISIVGFPGFAGERSADWPAEIEDWIRKNVRS
jgi:hypothetical protein